MFDIVTQNAAVSVKDLSMEQALTKLMLMYNITSQDVPSSQLPNSVYSALDAGTLGAVGRGVLGINNSPVFGENCTVNNVPQFPFSGGPGVLAFHLTPMSVPQERRDNAIFCPSAILQATSDADQALALFVMMHSKWPHALHTQTKPTTLPNGLEPNNQIYVHTESLVEVPGLTTIDVILPRQGSAANPTNADAVRALAAVSPAFGPDGNQAGANILLNYVGIADNARVQVGLAPYLASWSLSYTMGTIKTFIDRLRSVVPVDRDLKSAREHATLLSTAFPHLMISDVASAGIPDSNEERSIGYSLANLSVPPTTAANFPVDATTQQLFQIIETDILAFNKHVLELVEMPPILAGAVQFAWLGNPHSYVCGLIQAMKVGATHNVFYSARRMPTVAWEGAFQSDIPGFQEAAYQMFSYSANAGNLLPAACDKALCNLHENIFNESLPVSHLTHGNTTVELTSFGRWMIPNFWATPIEDDGTRGASGETPVNLVDQWIYYFADALPKCFAPWVPPQGLDSNVGYGPQYDATLINNSNSAGDDYRPYTARQFNESNYLPNTVTPTPHDHSWRNIDLFCHVAGVTMVTYDGAAVGLEVNGPAAYIKQRAAPLHAGALRPTQTLDAANHTKPVVDDTGRLVYMSGAIANIAPVIAAMVRTSQVSRPVFRYRNITRQAILPTAKATNDFFTMLFKQQDFQKAPTPAPAAEPAVMPVGIEVQLIAQSPQLVTSSEQPPTTATV
jgi:hypothetical protein